jgi:hypothetical protein
MGVGIIGNRRSDNLLLHLMQPTSMPASRTGHHSTLGG